MNNNQKRIRKLSIINSILIISLSFIMVTYAAFRSYASQQTTDTLTGTTCLTTTITDESAVINVANAYPISDSEGLKSTPYTFKVSNNCDHYMTLNIGVETLTSSTIPSNLIKASINKVGKTTASAKLLTSGTVAEAQNGGTAYLLYSTNLAPNSDDSYELRVWFTESMTTDQGANKKWDGKVIVSSTAAMPETHLVVNSPTDSASFFTSNYSGATWNAKKGVLEINRISSNRQEIKLTNNNSNGTYFNNYLKELVSGTNTSVASGTDGSSYLIHEVDTKTNVTKGTAKALTYYSSRSTSSSAPNFTWDSTNLTWTSNNNKTASTTATITFKPSTAGSAAFCYTVSSEANYDKAAVYVDDALQKEVSGEATDCVILANLTTSNTIKVTYSKDGSQDSGNDNVVFSINDYTSSTSQVDVGYRYQGTNPNNYVAFNGELWRIIGIVDDDSHGISGKSLVKLIRVNSLGSFTWNASGSNNWSTASLNNLLNINYYNSDNTDINNYCKKYGNYSGTCDFGNDRGVKAISKNLIEQNVTWYLGGFDTAETPMEIYMAERSTTVVGNNPTSSKNPVGLLYPSDYAYSTPSVNCSRATKLSSYNNSLCAGKSWIYSDGGTYTLSPNISTTTNIWYIISTGYLNKYGATGANNVRPVIYLQKNVKRVSGTGSIDDPYILSL